MNNSKEAEFNILVINGHDKYTQGKRTFKFEDGTFMIENDHNEPVAEELVKLFGINPRFNVFFITPEDTYKSIRDRADQANNYYRANGSDYSKWICISTHANAYGDTWNSANGSEVLFNHGSKRGEHFARCIAPKLAASLEVNDRGIKPRTDIGILRLTEMPCVLTEAAFMTNKVEAKKLMDPKYRLKEAKAIYDGICEGFGVLPLDQKEEKNIIIKYDSDQDEELIISSKYPLTTEGIIELLNGHKTVKEYSFLEIQNTLYKIGYYCGPIDGLDGPKSKKGISGFSTSEWTY